MNELVESMVERELGAAASVVGRVDEGLIHETYAVRVDGDDYVLQVADADESKEEVLARGLHCYRLLRDSGIPVPDLVTESVREYDGRTYVVVERLPGTTGERDVSPERTRNAGRYLAEIHDAVRFETTGWLRFDDDEVTTEGFREGSLDGWRHRKVRDNAEYLQAGGLEDVGTAVEGLFDRERVASRDGFRPVLCHNDYSPDNVLFRDGAVSGILDFDHAYAGDRRRDVVKAANGFWMHDPNADWNVRETFYDGYRDVTDLGPGFEGSEPLYRVETLAVLVGGMARMGELSAYEREFYAERLRDAIDRLPGR